jgi:hypothetical protein
MRAKRLVFLLPFLVPVSGCATIFGGGTSQAVSFASDPVPARFVVKSSSGLQMAQGKAPSTVELPRKNEYQIEITSPGYEPQTMVLTKGVNGWVWTNLIVGGIVGFAIDCVFRPIPFAHFAASRSPISLHVVQSFRSKPFTHFAHVDHRFRSKAIRA